MSGKAGLPSGQTRHKIVDKTGNEDRFKRIAVRTADPERGIPETSIKFYVDFGVSAAKEGPEEQIPD